MTDRPFRWLVWAGAASVVGVFVALAVLMVTEKRESATAPDYRVTPIAGIQYEAMNGRPIDPANAIDRKIIAGLPARDRQLRHGEMLFGAFISFTNASARPLRSAERIDLRIGTGPVYHPLHLPVTNPYAYSARVIRPRTRIPAVGDIADDLAAGGKLLVFRVPASQYDGEAAFELVIHHGRQTASLII